MHTDSSASITYFASASASEWTATVLMPISRQARWMRSAISPRLAIRIFSNMVRAALFDQEERLAIFHRLPVLDEDRLDRAGSVGFALVQQLHGLDDAKRLHLGDRLPDLHEGGCARRGRAVERPHHRRLQLMSLGFRRGFDGGRRGRVRQGGCAVGHGLHLGRHHHGGPGRRLARDAHLLLAFGDLDLADPGFLDEVDQLLQLAQVHQGVRDKVRAAASRASSYPIGPRPAITPAPRSEKYEGRRNSSRAWILDKCTSMNGMRTAARASRSATLVWVKAAGLMMMYAVSSLFAA